MERYPSDIIGDDTVLDCKEATIQIDPTAVSVDMALQLTQRAGFHQQPDHVIGKLVKGNDARDLMNPIEFVIPVEGGLTAIEELGIIESDADTNTTTDADVPRGE